MSEPQSLASLIREFIVQEVGHDGGEGMTLQAEDLAGRITRFQDDQRERAEWAITKGISWRNKYEAQRGFILAFAGELEDQANHGGYDPNLAPLRLECATRLREIANRKDPTDAEDRKEPKTTEVASEYIGTMDEAHYAVSVYWQQDLMKRALAQHLDTNEVPQGHSFTVTILEDGLHAVVKEDRE